MQCCQTKKFLFSFFSFFFSLFFLIFKKREYLAIVVDRGTQSVKVLLLDQELVVRLVDGLDVALLDRDEVRLDQGQVVELLEDANDAGVVHTRSEDGQEVVDQRGLVVVVELDALVVVLGVGNLDHNVLELTVLPGIGRLHTKSENSLCFYPYVHTC